MSRKQPPKDRQNDDNETDNDPFNIYGEERRALEKPQNFKDLEGLNFPNNEPSALGYGTALVRGPPLGGTRSGDGNFTGTNSILDARQSAVNAALGHRRGLSGSKYNPTNANSQVQDALADEESFSMEDYEKLKRNTDCKFRDKCKRLGCIFVHPAGFIKPEDPRARIECRWNPNCNRPGCAYLHLEANQHGPQDSFSQQPSLYSQLQPPVASLPASRSSTPSQVEEDHFNNSLNQPRPTHYSSLQQRSHGSFNESGEQRQKSRRSRTNLARDGSSYPRDTERDDSSAFASTPSAYSQELTQARQSGRSNNPYITSTSSSSNTQAPPPFRTHYQPYNAQSSHTNTPKTSRNNTSNPRSQPFSSTINTGNRPPPPSNTSRRQTTNNTSSTSNSYDSHNHHPQSIPRFENSNLREETFAEDRQRLGRYDDFGSRTPPARNTLEEKEGGDEEMEEEESKSSSPLWEKKSQPARKRDADINSTSWW